MGRYDVDACERDQNWKLSVDVELTVKVAGPAAKTAGLMLALYRVSGTVGGVNEPTEAPTAGRLLHVKVPSAQELDDVDTTC